MDLLLRPWRHYADFSGRSRRSEYFLFYLVLYGAIFVIAVIGGLLSDAKEGMSGIAIGALVLFVLAAIIPSLAVSVRRMHDQNKSGAWLFISFVPYIGWLIFLVLSFMPGTEGENDYGWNPRDEDMSQTADIFR